MYRPCYITGNSMNPQYMNEDVVLVNTRYKTLVKGDIVVIKTPPNTNIQSPYIIKRVIATGKDNVFVYKGRLYVNSKPSKYLYVGHNSDIAPLYIPKGHIWVLGDNLKHSRDSRIFGTIPVSTVYGKVVSKVDKNLLKSTPKGYKPKSVKDAFNMVKFGIYHELGLDK